MNKHQQKKLRQHRVRAKISGTAARPRLNVFRSLKAIYAQLIDDEAGKTLAAASSKEVSAKGGSAFGGKSKGKKTDVAGEVGKLIAEKAKNLGITEAKFDRAGYKYHGRIKSLAEAARLNGLKF